MASQLEELTNRVRSSIVEVAPEQLQQELQGSPRPILLDVREEVEAIAAHIHMARNVPRGRLELVIGAIAPDHDHPIRLYCTDGKRSILAARSLAEFGYRHAASMTGGIDAWIAKGLPIKAGPKLTSDQIVHATQLGQAALGAEGQAKLATARVLLVGGGDQGSPLGLYLASAGVGTIGIVNLVDDGRTSSPDQILGSDGDMRHPQTRSPTRTLTDLNPDVSVIEYRERLTSSGVMRVLDDGWHVIADTCERFQTRAVISDACVLRGIPNVHGSVTGFEGQATIFAPHLGAPCYRCVHPEPPPNEAADPGEGGERIGAVAGVIGAIQALEIVKLLLGRGTSLAGRLLRYDALDQRLREVVLRREPSCPVCGDGSEPKPPPDDEEIFLAKG